MSFDGRLKNAQKLMKKSGFGALMLHPGVNMYSMTGLMKESYERLLTVIVPAEGEPVAVVPMFEVEAVSQSVKVPLDVRGWREDEDPYELVRDVVQGMGAERTTIAIDGKMEYIFYSGIEHALPSAKFSQGTSLLNELRVLKSADEIELIERAAAIACRAIRIAFERARPGMTEIEIRDILRAEAKKEEGIVEGNVSSGQGTALPHWQTSNKKISKGELLLIDIGLRYHWYYGDITRVAVLGTPTDKQKRVYGVVLKAQEAACDAVIPGVEAQQVDRIARKIIDEAGFGEQFTHRVGHGLGLEIHEQPYLVEGNTQKLQPGMVHTVEPGVYLLGEFGVRIEDNLVVTSDGSKNLSKAALPRDELIPVG